MNRILSSKETGRDWGDKVPPKLIRRADGMDEWEADAWDGPSVPGERGQYIRHRWRGRMPK